MAKEKILEKLNDILSRENLHEISEAEVIYILSKVRKLMELDGSKEKYQFLNFYCNLALHAKLEGRPPQKVQNMMLKIHNQDESFIYSIFWLEDFHNEFKLFINEKELPSKLYEEENIKKNLSEKLFEIFSDTPITLTLEQKYLAKFHKINGNKTFSIFPKK